MKKARKVKQARHFLRRSSKAAEEADLVVYKDLVSAQEIIRDVGTLLDKFTKVAPGVFSFTIDTPRHSFVIVSGERVQSERDK